MNVLVTGGAGFIGSYVVEELQAHGHTVRIFDVAPPTRVPAETVIGDLCDLAQVEQAVSGCEAVCHLAAIPTAQPRPRWPAIMQVNVIGSYNVLEAAARRQLRKVVMASSVVAEGWWPSHVAILNHPQYLPVDEDHPALPDEPYGMSKLFGDVMARGFVFHFGLSVICLRLANVIAEAPARGTAALATDFRWVKVDPRDAAQAFRLALESSILFGVYHIGSRHLYHADGSVWTGEEVRAAIRDWQVGEIRDEAYLMAGRPFMTSAKAERELGYNPRY
jgi:nucleoside-diphosphate-sugar epimerase